MYAEFANVADVRVKFANLAIPADSTEADLSKLLPAEWQPRAVQIPGSWTAQKDVLVF